MPVTKEGKNSIKICLP